MQQGARLRIAVEEVAVVGATIGRDCFPGVEQVIDGFAQRGVTADHGRRRRPVEDHPDDVGSGASIIHDIDRRSVRCQRWDHMAHRGDDHGGQRSVQGSRRPRGHARGFDCPIEAGVELAERFVMEPVARFLHVEQRENKARLVRLASDAARRLDVFGRGLGLALNHHEAEARNIEAYGNHVGRQRYVDAERVARILRQAFFRRRDVVGALARRQLKDLPQAAISERLVRGRDPPALVPIGRELSHHFVFDDPPRAAELPQGVEVAKR